MHSSLMCLYYYVISLCNKRNNKELQLTELQFTELQLIGVVPVQRSWLAGVPVFAVAVIVPLSAA